MKLTTTAMNESRLTSQANQNKAGAVVAVTPAIDIKDKLPSNIVGKKRTRNRLIA
jgi:hypothetical protein